MATEKKKRGAPEHLLWKKGQSGNPGGRPKGDSDLQELKCHATDKILRHMLEHGGMTVSELTKRLNDDKTVMLERVIGKIYTKAALGSLPHANVILERIAGPVPKSVTLEGNADKPLIPELNGYSGEVLTATLIRLKKEAEVLECQTLTPQLLPELDEV